MQSINCRLQSQKASVIERSHYSVPSSPGAEPGSRADLAKSRAGRFTSTLCIQIITVTYAYRKAEETDREAIYQLYCLVMRGFISDIWGWDEQWQRADFSTHFYPRGVTLAFQEDQLAGYSHVENRDGQLFIRMIVVHPHHQRKGIGKKLLESVVASAGEQSKNIGLEVFKINDVARAFYERYGFNMVGETPTSHIMVHA